MEGLVRGRGGVQEHPPEWRAAARSETHIDEDWAGNRKKKFGMKCRPIYYQSTHRHRCWQQNPAGEGKRRRESDGREGVREKRSKLRSIDAVL